MTSVRQETRKRKAVYQRKEELFPDWEIVYIALPKNDRKKRCEYLEWMLRTEKENQDV